MKQSDVYRLAESAPIKRHSAKMVLMSLCGNSGGGFDWSTWSKKMTASYIYTRFNRYSGSDSEEMHEDSLSMRTIVRALKELQTIGVITLSDHRSKGDYLITLNIDKLVEMSKPRPKTDCHTPTPDCHTSDCHTPMPDCHTPPDKLTYPPMSDCPPPMTSWPTPSVKLAHNKVSLSLNQSNKESLNEESEETENTNTEDDSHLSNYQKAKLRSQKRHKNSSMHAKIKDASTRKARSYS